MLRTRPWLLFLVALVLVGACRCDDPGLGNARGDFRPQQAEVDFGRVLEGTQSRRTVTLLGTGRAGVTVTATASAPFSVVQDAVSVPGGGSAEVEVVFTAGEGPAEGTLVLTAGSRIESVALRGVGVRPLACVPTVQCRESRFELEPGRCVETLVPDGTTCIPDSRCQVNGQCLAGVCVGTPRTCDDDNPCTVDSCSPTRGCVTTDVVCPRPSNPCRVGVCKRESGCGEEDALDYVLCGPADCKTVDVCLSGTCRTLPTPEGFLCAPETPCQGEGRCRSGECVRPDAGDLVAEFSAGLGGAPMAVDGGPVLLAHNGALFASVCDEDGGCRLVSFTGNGLLRFEAPYPDGGLRTLLAVSDAGVLVHEPGALESYALSSPGARLWQWEASTGVGRTALTAEGEVVALVSPRAPADAGVALDGGEDGGTSEALATLVLLGTDGGVLRASAVEGFRGAGARVALDELGAVLLCAEGAGQVVRAEPEPADAGTGFLLVPLADLASDGGVLTDGGSSLAVAGGRLFAGARAFASTDGGELARVAWEGGAQHLVPFDEPTLLLGDVGYAFARACPPDGGVPCRPEVESHVLRALEARDGGTLWEVPMAPPGTAITLHEASLVRGGAVGTLSDLPLDGGTQRSFVQLFAQGRLVAACPLEGQPRVAGATHVGSLLYVLLERDGTWMLEAFDLGPQGTAETRGWPQRHGVAGTRRARP